MKESLSALVLANVFGLFNELNFSMEGSASRAFTAVNKIDDFQKLAKWIERVIARCFDMIYNFFEYLNSLKHSGNLHLPPTLTSSNTAFCLQSILWVSYDSE
jgi:hypothetical protein